MIFLDDITDTLKMKCVVETIIRNLYCLFNSDDTLLISTERNEIIRKCKTLSGALKKKKMKLNIKSG